jgi:uncharacterized cupin superfamily protein
MLINIYDLPPGTSSGAYHYEYDEEWLLVVEGSVVLRTPEGERPLERGDLVFFPLGPAVRTRFSTGATHRRGR